MLKPESYFYFVLFLFVLGISWAAYSLFTNHFTQLYGWDYELQYVPFYYDYWDTWHEFFETGHFRLYDHQTFLGTDNIGSNSYYGLFDPFVVAMILFPRSWIPQMTAIMTLVKLVVCAVLMRGYLKYMGIQEWTARLGAIACAFSGFMNFMVGFPSFVSAVTYMPLVLWGIEKVIRDRKISRLVWGLFFEGITCFFLLVPMCVFGVMYAVFRYFQTVGTRNWKTNISVILLGIFAFAVGIMMSAWVLLPSVRESSLSGRTVSIGRFYLDAVLASLKESDFSQFFHLIFEPVGGNPGRELMALISFFYPTCNYLYLPLAYPGSVGGSDYHYDAWTASIFCYTLFAILFFLALMNSVRKKKWSHLIAVVLICFLLFTTSAYYFFFLFSGNGYGRWFFVLVPVIIYYGCWAFDDREEQPKWFMLAATVLSLFGTVFTYLLTLWVLKGNVFVNENGLTYWPNFYLTAGETKADGSLVNGTWTRVVDNRIWYIYYQISLVVVQGVILILWNRKKWVKYPLLALMSAEAIVMGNASFAYGSSYPLTSFLGGESVLSNATIVNRVIEESDSSFYRSYFDMPNDTKNFANGIGFNGTSTFHSLANFNVMDYCRMTHISNWGSSGKSYGQSYYNASWSGFYANKRFGTDTQLGIKYYAIRRDGYGAFQGRNVPFGSVKVFTEQSASFHYIYDIYQNVNVPELGHAVDKNQLHHMLKAEEYPRSEWSNAFYSSRYGVGGCLEVMKNEDFMLTGAIIDDGVTLPEGFPVSDETPFDEAYVNRINKRERAYNASIYVTDASDGDLFLDLDIVIGEDGKAGYVRGEHYNEGPGYFLHYYEPQDLENYRVPNTAYYQIPKDTGHVVLTPRSGAYFNEDPAGAYFTMYYGNSKSDDNPIRIFMIGDTFNQDGTVKETDTLLAFEFHAIDALAKNDNSYRGYFGFYPEGRVKYVVFETNGPSGETKYQYFPNLGNLRLYMQERHEEYSATKNPGDSLEARSRYVAKGVEEDKTDDYLLHDVKTINNDSFTFKTYYSEEQLVVTQIAYDEGWKVKAEGRELQTYRVNGGFVGFIAPAGETSYSFYFETPQLKDALAIAIVGAFLYLGYLGYDFIRIELAYRKAKEEAALGERPD
ncbi:MAG: YfhO family protein [Bacilli bacterium]|nr:YfhO family protein [Bacilli bacterium]